MNNYQYQIGGILANNLPTYVVRQAASKLYEALKYGEFCYVLNSRQMGKSSLLVRTQHRLQNEGFQCSTTVLAAKISPLYSRIKALLGNCGAVSFF